MYIYIYIGIIVILVDIVNLSPAYYVLLHFFLLNNSLSNDTAF